MIPHTSTHPVQSSTACMCGLHDVIITSHHLLHPIISLHYTVYTPMPVCTLHQAAMPMPPHVVPLRPLLLLSPPQPQQHKPCTHWMRCGCSKCPKLEQAHELLHAPNV